MANKIKDLIKILKEKDQNAEVEYIVVKTDSKIVCMNIKSTAPGMVNLLGCFGGADQPTDS